MGLEWNWRESSPCNVLIARRLSVDYTLLRYSISEKRPSSCVIRAPLRRCIVCSHDDAVLFVLSCSFRLGVVAVARKFARELHNVVRRYARAVRTVRLGDECDRLSFERRGAVLCTDPRALVDTPVINGCYVRAGRCRAVRTERSRPTSKVSLV